MSADILTAARWRSTCEQLLDRSLPFAAWTHEAHLLVALYAAITSADLAEMTGLLRQEIQAYNSHNGVEQTPEGGYHETVTAAFAQVIWRYTRTRPEASQPRPDGTFFEQWLPAARDLVAGPMRDKRYLLQFYSRERINSIEARYGWLEPDLTPLPTA